MTNNNTIEEEVAAEAFDPERCPNGRLHRGVMDPSWYKYDMDDDEWYGNDGW